MATALAYMNEAADLGNAEAMNALGFMYFNGDPLPQNYTKALDYFTVRVFGSLVFIAAQQHSISLGAVYTPTACRPGRNEEGPPADVVTGSRDVARSGRRRRALQTAC